jgi:glycerol-3-phosphate acyltransferase PlsX
MFSKPLRACQIHHPLPAWQTLDGTVQREGEEMVRIALDAMGGDYAPEQLVKGALSALQERADLYIQLVGEPETLRQLLSAASAELQQRVAIVPADDVITNDDSPALAVRRRKTASIVVATALLSSDEADALVTAGSTGAFMAAGLLVLGRLPEIQRPALAPVLPTVDGKGVVLLDVGANMDARPENLAQYALMGSIYADVVLQRQNPRVGLLNVGTERGKGNQLAKDAYDAIDTLPLNFVGNVEARDLLSGVADVVVADGFVGNVVLKLMEGMGMAMMGMLMQAMQSIPDSQAALATLQPGLKRLKQQFDASEYGGAPLLGVRKPMVKCHGNADQLAIKNGLLQTARFVEQGFISRVAAAVSSRAE